MYNAGADGVDWDEANIAHIARHGITPEECEETYRNGPLVIEARERKRGRRSLWPSDRIYHGFRHGPLLRRQDFEQFRLPGSQRAQLGRFQLRVPELAELDHQPLGFLG